MTMHLLRGLPFFPRTRFPKWDGSCGRLYGLHNPLESMKNPITHSQSASQSSAILFSAPDSGQGFLLSGSAELKAEFIEELMGCLPLRSSKRRSIGVRPLARRSCVCGDLRHLFSCPPIRTSREERWREPLSGYFG